MGVWPGDAQAGQKNKVSANDKVQIALVGCKGVGWSNALSHLKLPDVELVALCDIDQSVLDQRNSELEKQIGKKVKEYKDYRKLLEDKDLDAVIIGTPDHWHALQTIHACEAGKDVYVEKPLANYVEECKQMVKATRKYNRVVQVGQQQRSGAHWQSAVEYLRSGKLGRIYMAKAWIYNDWKPAVPIVADSTPPVGVDYDMWLGPAPKRPFNMNRFHGSFRWYWDYAGGLMTDWGVHLLDIILWGLDLKAPKAVTAMGGKLAYPTDAMEIPDTLKVLYEFDGCLVEWEHTFGIGRGPFDKGHGTAFYGEKGTLVATRQGWEVIPEYDYSDPKLAKYRMESLPAQRSSTNDRDLHAADFIACIKSRKDPICPIEVGAHVASVSHLGNIALRVGNRLQWDDASGSFKGGQGNQLLSPNYRAPWKLPVF